MKKIRVLPIKKLCALNVQRQIPAGSAAVLCTLNQIPTEQLAGINYIHVPFIDVLDKKRPDAFTEEKARVIRQFVDELPEEIMLFFCCDSGQSRSTALAAAFKRYLGQDERVIWDDVRYHPNRLVYGLQCKACGRKSSWLRTRLLSLHNRLLFKKQIRNGERN